MFDPVVAFFRRRLLAVAITVASTMVALQMIMPSGIDFIFGLINIGLLWVVAKLAGGETHDAFEKHFGGKS